MFTARGLDSLGYQQVCLPDQHGAAPREIVGADPGGEIGVAMGNDMRAVCRIDRDVVRGKLVPPYVGEWRAVGLAPGAGHVCSHGRAGELRGLTSVAQQRLDDFGCQVGEGHHKEYAEEAGRQASRVSAKCNWSEPKYDGKLRE